MQMPPPRASIRERGDEAPMTTDGGESETLQHPHILQLQAGSRASGYRTRTVPASLARMTFSIVARSADGESWGVAVASKFLAVGSAVPAAVAQVGAIATQADANVAYKGLALAHLDDGATASVALQRLLEEDDGRDHRQVGIVDADGGAATHTGPGLHRLGRRPDRRRLRDPGQHPRRSEVVEAMEAMWLRRRGRAARPPAARRPGRRRRGRRRQARPPVGRAARRTRGGGVRRRRRHRRRPAGRRPRGPGRRAGAAARPQRPLPDRLHRGGEGAGRRRAAGRARGVRAHRGAPRLRHLGGHRELRDAGRRRPVVDRPADPRRRPRGGG